MPFTKDACGWVVSELAIALGVDPSALAQATLPDTVPYSEVADDFDDDNDEAGVVVAWGDNDEGETDVPRGLDSVIAVAAGWYHSLAVTGDGKVVAWGSSARGMTDVPARLSGVTTISAGRYHSLALTVAGTITAWGGNGYRQSTCRPACPGDRDRRRRRSQSRRGVREGHRLGRGRKRPDQAPPGCPRSRRSPPGPVTAWR